MAELTKQRGQAIKAEGELDPAKQGIETAASDVSTEVEGRSVLIFVTCPYCKSLRVVCLDYEGEWFQCDHCHNNYQIVS